MQNRARGFTLFEFAVACLVIGVLAGLLLGRVREYSSEAERAAVAQLVGNLRTALQLQGAGRAAQPGDTAMRELVQSNPLDLLADKPVNYLGEYYSPDLDKLPAGNWLFDRRDKSLIYLLDNHRNILFYNAKFLKFKVELFQMASTAEGRAPGAAPDPRNVVGLAACGTRKLPDLTERLAPC